MAQSKNSKTGKKPEAKQKKGKRRGRFRLSDNQKWVAGLILLFFAVWTLWVCGSYFFTWNTDQTFTGFNGAEAMADPTADFVSAADAIPTGEKGSLGVRLARRLVGHGFGVFAAGIPVMLFIVGLRLMRFRPAALERSVRVTFFGMILGSVTLGLVFGIRPSIFGSGLGGELGIFSAQWLRGKIGIVGAALSLVCLWILWAVYISRKTISHMNRVGQVIVGGSAKAGGLVTGPRDDADEDEYGEETDDEYFDNESEEESTDDDEARTNVVTGKPGMTVNEAYAAAIATGTPPEESPFIVREIGAEGHTVEIDKPEEPVRPAVIRTPDGVFEVVELGGVSAGATTLGAGGVVTSDGEGMEVLQTEKRDTEVADDDIENRLYDPLKELSTYRKPEIESILANHGTRVEVTDEEIQVNSNRIVQTLRNFGVEISKIKATIGPTVTLYEVVPAPGVKISKIKGLEQDIALSLKALGIRIIAPMPGKGTIGIEVPNQNREIVSMYSLVKSIRFQDSTAELPLVLGKTIQNETFLVDLAKMPHLLIAGATGQGKSVGLNVIISSLLYKKHPAEVKFVMVDPKKVELSLYSRLEKHFLAKMESEEDAILTDTQKVVYTLNSLCGEMEARYELLRKAEVKKISEYNEKFINRRLNPNKGHRYLPYIVVVIDEFADMIMTAGKEVEQPITRLAQLARATGIHLIIATQRPDVKVITGLIKANFPARIAFRVTSIVDSRTILDQTGANQLIGQGDMLISLNGEITRLQCAFIDTPEIERMTGFIQDQRGYPNAYSLPDWVPDSGDNGGGSSGEIGDVDRMFEEVARFVVANQQGSTSNIQRHFAIGYNRAGRLMDQLERAGIVGRAEGSKPREVLIQDPRSLERIFEDIL